MKLKSTCVILTAFLLQPLYGEESATSCNDLNGAIRTLILDIGVSEEQVQQAESMFDKTLGFSSIEGLSEEIVNTIRNDELARCRFYRIHYMNAMGQLEDNLNKGRERIVSLLQRLHDVRTNHEEAGETSYLDYLDEQYNLSMREE